MSDDDEVGIFEIEVEYTDSGLKLVPDMDAFRERAREDFGTFDSLIDFYQKEPGELSEQFTEQMEEWDEKGHDDEPGIVVTNIPQDWQDDPSQLAHILELIHNQMVRMGLGFLIEQEVQEEEKMLTDGLYKPLIIRQSAFYEDLLKLRCQFALQEQKQAPLSNKEFKIIDNMGHRSRLRLARLFDVVDKHEHGMLQQMATHRNEIAHNAWPGIDPETESQIESTAEKVLAILKSEIEEAEEEMNLEEEDAGEFDIGFTGLDVETQNFQLSILDLLVGEEDPVPLGDIKQVLPEGDGEIQQRCLLMEQIGYVDMPNSDGPLSITEQGEQLLEQHSF